MKIMMTMSLMTSTLLMLINHPMAMGLLMLMQIMLISIISGIISQTLWFTYTIVLIFIGGMMVLFIYVTSLASNEMFFLSMKLMLMTMLLTMLILLIMSYLKTQINNQETHYFIINNLMINKLMKLYNSPTNYITMMMASYLFLTLIAVIKIINIFKGPLRPMN